MPEGFFAAPVHDGGSEPGIVKAEPAKGTAADRATRIARDEPRQGKAPGVARRCFTSANAFEDGAGHLMSPVDSAPPQRLISNAHAPSEPEKAHASHTLIAMQHKIVAMPQNRRNDAAAQPL